MLRGFGFGGPLNWCSSSVSSSHLLQLILLYLEMATGSNVSTKKALFFETKFNWNIGRYRIILNSSSNRKKKQFNKLWLTSTVTLGLGLELYWVRNKSRNNTWVCDRIASILARIAQLSQIVRKCRQKFTVDCVRLMNVSPVTCDFISIPNASNSRNKVRRFDFVCKLYGCQTFSVRLMVSIKRTRDSSRICSNVVRTKPSMWYNRSNPISDRLAHGSRTPSIHFATVSSCEPFVR